MGKKFKLEAAGYLNTADATVSPKQDPLQAIDVGDWCEIALIVNVTEPATAGSLTFETAAEPFEGPSLFSGRRTMCH